MQDARQFVGFTIILVLSAALILAIAYSVVNLLRVGYVISREGRHRRQNPPRVLIHPEFGTLTGEFGLWSGHIQKQGREIPYNVAGSEVEANARLLDSLRNTVERFEEFERLAIAFLQSRHPDMSDWRFNFDAIDFLWENRPDEFVMEFTLAGDTYAIWRVEFRNGLPHVIGRDD